MPYTISLCIYSSILVIYLDTLVYYNREKFNWSVNRVFY